MSELLLKLIFFTIIYNNVFCNVISDSNQAKPLNVQEIATTSKSSANLCSNIPICSCTDKSLICENFNNFTELNFSNLNKKLIFDTVKISPIDEQDFSQKNLNLEGIQIKSSANIEISNIRSFSFESNPLKGMRNPDRKTNYVLKISNSNFRFTYKNRPLNENCGNIMDSNPSIFESANMVYLDNIKFSEPICPLVFKNTKINHLFIRNPSPSNSFKFTESFNQLEETPEETSTSTTTTTASGPAKRQGGVLFKKLRQLPEILSASIQRIKSARTVGFTKLNSIIKFLTIEDATIDHLDSKKLLNYDVFASLKSFKLDNVNLKSIEPGVFNRFKVLNKIEFRLTDWKSFLENNEEWLNTLNSKVESINANETRRFESNRKLVLGMDGRTKQNYRFPDEDFCYFDEFPFDKSVIPFINTKNDSCSCTILWLNKYYPSNDMEFGQTTGSICVRSNHTCNFTKMINDCRTKNSKSVFNRIVNFSNKTFGKSIKYPLIGIFVVCSILTGLLIVCQKHRSKSYNVIKKKPKLRKEDDNGGGSTEFDSFNSNLNVKYKTLSDEDTVYLKKHKVVSSKKGSVYVD